MSSFAMNCLVLGSRWLPIYDDEPYNKLVTIMAISSDRVYFRPVDVDHRRILEGEDMKLLDYAWTVHEDELWIETIGGGGMIVVDPPNQTSDMDELAFQSQKAIMEHIATVHNQWLIEQEATP